MPGFTGCFVIFFTLVQHASVLYNSTLRDSPSWHQGSMALILSKRLKHCDSVSESPNHYKLVMSRACGVQETSHCAFTCTFFVFLAVSSIRTAKQCYISYYQAHTQQAVLGENSIFNLQCFSAFCRYSQVT